MKDLSLHNCRLDGRYDIYGLLGRGSYAEIYVARDILASPQSPHSSVVIKALNVFLQEELDSDLERTLVENFQNEAIALDRVRHPNIISRLGHGTARDLNGMVFHFIVLEYLSGGDLSQLSKQQRIEPQQIFIYLEQVCAGLAHAHKCGVIHRDIKPQNLLLTSDRKVAKIADFGVARLTQNMSPVTRVGTNVYAPPEHSPIYGASHDASNAIQLTPAADVYSLAKSTYALFVSESPRRFSNAPITEFPSTMIQSDWTNELLRLLHRATSDEAGHRPQSIEEYWFELAKIKLLFEEESGEQETHVVSRPHLIPQPAVTKGFSANAPVRPHFNTARELQIANYAAPKSSLPEVVGIPMSDRANIPLPPPRYSPYAPNREKVRAPLQKKSRGFVSRLFSYAIFLALFAGALFATQSYLRTGKVMPEIRLPFSQQTGVTVTDVNLRPDPSVENEKIGVVPRASRVRIVKTLDNWYEIDVLEFSRPKDNPSDPDHGWVSRKYVDLD